jgi:hypothetical protein
MLVRYIWIMDALSETLSCSFVCAMVTQAIRSLKLIKKKIINTVPFWSPEWTPTTGSQPQSAIMNSSWFDAGPAFRFQSYSMAKPLVLTFGGMEVPFALSKVERSDLYGFIETETLDEQDRKCFLATLADDGRSIVPSGGTALVTLSPEGNWLEKKTLTPTDNQGNRISPCASSYAAPCPLEKTASIDEYLSHNIRAVYQVSSEADFSPLMDELQKGTIFQFPYSFRGGLEPDMAFLLLSADGTPFIAIGAATRLDFVGFDQTAAVVEEENPFDDDDESVDFGMM